MTKMSLASISETSSLELTQGFVLISLGAYNLVNGEQILSHASYTMFSFLPPLIWGVLMVLFGLIQILATIINGLAIRWTPYFRFLACCAGCVFYGFLSIGLFKADFTGWSVPILVMLTFISALVSILKANVIIERLSVEHDPDSRDYNIH